MSHAHQTLLHISALWQTVPQAIGAGDTACIHLCTVVLGPLHAHLLFEESGMHPLLLRATSCHVDTLVVWQIALCRLRLRPPLQGGMSPAATPCQVMKPPLTCIEQHQASCSRQVMTTTKSAIMPSQATGNMWLCFGPDSVSDCLQHGWIKSMAASCWLSSNDAFCCLFAHMLLYMMPCSSHKWYCLAASLHMYCLT